MYWSIDNRNSACDHRIFQMDYLHFGFTLVWLIDNEYIVYSTTT